MEEASDKMSYLHNFPDIDDEVCELEFQPINSFLKDIASEIVEAYDRENPDLFKFPVRIRLYSSSKKKWFEFSIKRKCKYIYDADLLKG